MSEDDPKAVTREEFERMTPFAKGYATYMQGAWNEDLLDVNPYPEGTTEYRAFASGMYAGMLTAQDSE